VCDTKLELLVEQPATLPHLRRVRGGGLFEPEDAPIGVPDLSGETPVSERNTRGSRGSVQNKGAIRLFRMTRKSDERELVGRLFGTLKGLCANCGCLPRLAAPASSDSLRRGTGARHIARPRPGAARSPEASLLHKDGAQSDHLRSSAGSSSSKPRTSCEPWPSGNPGRQTGNQFFPAVFASLERYGDVSSVTGGA
jgi:hypothetical protein